MTPRTERSFRRTLAKTRNPPCPDGTFRPEPDRNARFRPAQGRTPPVPAGENGLHFAARRHGPGKETRDAHRRRIGGSGPSAAVSLPSAAGANRPRGGAPGTGPLGAGPPRLPAHPPEAPRPRHHRRLALRVLGRRHRDRLGHGPCHPPPRAAVGAPRGVLRPHRGGARVPHRVLRFDEPGAARRARGTPPDPPGRPVRIRVSRARSAAPGRGDRGRGTRPAGCGARSGSHDGRPALEARDVRVVGFPGGVGGGAGTLDAQPRAGSASGVDDPRAGGGAGTGSRR